MNKLKQESSASDLQVKYDLTKLKKWSSALGLNTNFNIDQNPYIYYINTTFIVYLWIKVAKGGNYLIQLQDKIINSSYANERSAV